MSKHDHLMNLIPQQKNNGPKNYTGTYNLIVTYLFPLSAVIYHLIYFQLSLCCNNQNTQKNVGLSVPKIK